MYKVSHFIKVVHRSLVLAFFVFLLFSVMFYQSPPSKLYILAYSLLAVSLVIFVIASHFFDKAVKHEKKIKEHIDWLEACDYYIIVAGNYLAMPEDKFQQSFQASVEGIVRNESFYFEEINSNIPFDKIRAKIEKNKKSTEKDLCRNFLPISPRWYKFIHTKIMRRDWIGCVAEVSTVDNRETEFDRLLTESV